MTDAERTRLIDAALRSREVAYAPYSNYRVGAALLAGDGTIYTGCNVENATYGATVCAERTAVVKAVSEGVRDFRAVAVAAEHGGIPCGICRQVLYEFAPDLLVIAVDAGGRVVGEYTLSEDLLPNAWGAKDLDGFDA
ncbi:MAG: cytidine deaminase [Anaerolineae bacterium]|nr:cytidine deaminase [Anaerolineae bacterium]